MTADDTTSYLQKLDRHAAEHGHQLAPWIVVAGQWRTTCWRCKGTVIVGLDGTDMRGLVVTDICTQKE